METSRVIAVIEDRSFLRECFRQGVQSMFSLPVIAFPTIAVLEENLHGMLLELIIVSLPENSKNVFTETLVTLSKLFRSVPIVMLSEDKDSELARTAIFNGAKGCIPLTMEFTVAIEALRFVLAGGTYVPIDCLMESARMEFPLEHPPVSRAITEREMEIVRRIQQGKPNNAIAHDLNVSENTVKLHLRQLIKKFKARIASE